MNNYRIVEQVNGHGVSQWVVQKSRRSWGVFRFVERCFPGFILWEGIYDYKAAHHDTLTSARVVLRRLEDEQKSDNWQDVKVHRIENE